MLQRKQAWHLLPWLLLVKLSAVLCGQTTGMIAIDFREEQSGDPIACRVKILSSQGREQRVRGANYYQGWNLIEGTLTFKGRPGDYTYQAAHGPQFSTASGGFTLDRSSEGQALVDLPRHATIGEEGWIGGDLLVHMPADETAPWLPAEDLTLAACTSRELDVEDNEQTPAHEWISTQTYHDDRVGSGLLLHHWLPPAEVPKGLPSSRLLVMAKDSARNLQQPTVHAEIQRLWARDVPIWLASERIDSIQVLSDHISYDGTEMAAIETLVDPDPRRFRGPRRNGRLVEYFYWQVLETGLRIPPTAGSGFGKSPSPLGAHRVYAFLSSATSTSWWEAVRAGRTFVTSGPLLRTTLNGERPGYVFRAKPGTALEISVAMTLTVADPVEYLDIIFNGQTLYQARLDEYAKAGGRIPPLSVDESGWLVVRVVTERADTYRVATTAPYYVEIGPPRISRKAVELFQTWLEKGVEQMASGEPALRAASEPYIQAARAFWNGRQAQATVD